ncbi:MAG TPA: hypothetical protein PLI05_08790 [Methanotrichaceae archaeon]|nr:hypothetical protein [Methanotrichaceae archaeon]HQF17148.1 hypothetical protein [Methanotrichaceae archaeon]HQI91548.1 hypothetical protein [Methanotrichaceae archaeon]
MIFIAVLATHFNERSYLMAPLSLLAIFVLTNVFAYPLPEVVAVHFSGLDADGWSTKDEYLRRATSFYFLLTLFFIWASKDRKYMIPVMSGALVCVLFINAIVLSMPDHGANISILLYVPPLVLLIFLASYYRNMGDKIA